MITRDMYIEDMVRDYPQTVSILTKRGVICIQCGEPIWGTLGEALDRAGIKNHQELINELVNAANSGVSI